MNTHMVALLMRKDFHFFRKHLPGYLIAGLVSIAVACLPGTTAFYVGGVLLVSLLTTMGMHVPIAMVLGERRNKTLPLIMSLPITPFDYTCSKIAVSLATYAGMWGLLFAASVAAVLQVPQRYDGLVPFIVIVFVGCAANAVLILAAALVRDSLDKTVRAVVFWNLVLQAVVFSAASNPAIHASMWSENIDWSGAAVMFVLAELLTICIGIAAAFWRQSRKSQLI